MTLWDTKKLSEDLKSGALPENEKMKYFLFHSVMLSLFTSSFFHFTTSRPDKIEYIGDALAILVTIVGVIYAFKQNAKGDNKAFVERATCLSVPILVRLVAVVSLLGLPIGILFSGSNTDYDSYAWFVVTVLFEIIFYWRLSLWINRTSRS